MAERRMFSHNITDSASFLKMPSTSRLLYYDLGMNADDDGVVEAYTVMRKTGATEDDLRVLVTKGFVIVLNPEDLIVFIVQWRENNKIRADRKKDSIYKDLLLQIVPDVKLLEPAKRADLKSKEELDSNWTSNGLHSVGECSVGKDSITLHNKTLQYYYYLIGKSENFENSTDVEKNTVLLRLKALEIDVTEAIDTNLTEEKREDFILMYWAIKEIIFSSHRAYLNYLTRALLFDKFLKTCNYKSKNDTKNFLDYFIKTLKNELQRISESKVM